MRSVAVAVMTALLPDLPCTVTHLSIVVMTRFTDFVY